jgi:hypothetical protein
MGAVKISAFVIARDEEDRIQRCLRSLAWADERLVVVDAATRDATIEKARPLATDVVVREWEGFSATKSFALTRTRHPWVLWIDADEEVTPELAASIRAATESPRGRVGFRLHRRNRYLGKRIRHGTWSNDVVLRLFRREAGLFDDREIHESVVVDGPVGELDGCLDHDSYRNLAHHHEKMQAWARLWAAQALRDGRRAHRSDLLIRPPLRLLKGYLWKAGFLDGREGLILAFMDAVYVGMKYACLLEAQISGTARADHREGRSDGGDAGSHH